MVIIMDDELRKFVVDGSNTNASLNKNGFPIYFGSISNITIDGNFIEEDGFMGNCMGRTTGVTNKSCEIFIEGDVSLDVIDRLYRVFIVDKNRKVIEEKLIVAEDIEEARFEAGIDENIKARGLKLRDVTVLFDEIGAVKTNAVSDDDE